MARSPHGLKTIDAFARVLEGAVAEDGAPRPLCDGRSAEYIDYVGWVPSEQHAAALCAGCPLLDACLANARRVKPGWGVHGGIAWIDGRQAHLMPEDDERWETWVRNPA